MKAVTWRILATTTTIIIAYIITGETTLAFAIGGVELVVKMLVYYLHERAWQALPLGSVRKLLMRLKGNK